MLSVRKSCFERVKGKGENEKEKKRKKSERGKTEPYKRGIESKRMK